MAINKIYSGTLATPQCFFPKCPDCGSENVLPIHITKLSGNEIFKCKFKGCGREFLVIWKSVLIMDIKTQSLEQFGKKLIDELNRIEVDE